MRKDEGDFVEQTFTSLFDMNFVRVNCGDHFMQCLKGVTDPEEKRKIIGTEFYKVFWDEVRSRAEDGFFAQGTIYPDRIESGKGKSDGKANTAVIKTHHNMVKKPDDINFIDTIEPLGALFKDEVRKVGEKIGFSATKWLKTATKKSLRSSSAFSPVSIRSALWVTTEHMTMSLSSVLLQPTIS